MARMTACRWYRFAILILIFGCAAGCDQTSKHIARSQLSDLGSIRLPGGVGELRLAENLGSFLSIGASLPAPIRLAILIIGVGVGLLFLFAYLVISSPPSLMSFIGLAFVWAGGMSNLMDRIIREGHVTDFVFIRIGPLHTGVFNAADLMIMVGIATLGLDLWKRRHRRPPGKASLSNIR
jgi:signal peptidase II